MLILESNMELGKWDITDTFFIVSIAIPLRWIDAP